VFKLQATSVAAKLFWIDLGWVGVATIPVAWLLFALEYTGRDRYVRPRYVALLSVVPAVTVVLALTSDAHNLLYAQYVGTAADGTPVLQEGGAWYWVAAVYTYLLGIAGIVPLLDLLASRATAFRGQSFALLFGLLVPWVTNVMYVAGLFPTAGIDPTPVAFSVSGVAYLGAITRFRLLGTNPAPKVRARQYLFDQMAGGALVVDANDNVVDLNDSCASVLGRTRGAVLGRPLAEVLPEHDRLPEVGTLDGHLSLGEGSTARSFEATVSPVENVRGTPIGRVITFHDVSEYLRQEQRLKVLNRILRHNIRTETNVIHGYAGELPEQDEAAEIIRERALSVASMGEKGREAIELFERDGAATEPVPLSRLLARCVRRAREAYPDATVTLEGPAADAPVPAVLDRVFANLLENALEHADAPEPTVGVTAHVADGRASVAVRDDGPGIADYELAVLDAGTETPLKHGSGMGLWLVKWGVEMADGEVRFGVNDAGGTTATLEVPVLAADGTDDPRSVRSPGRGG
jgi:PAS domain S-box-containing protein